jgi:hypothetical protein
MTTTLQLPAHLRPCGNCGHPAMQLADGSIVFGHCSWPSQDAPTPCDCPAFTPPGWNASCATCGQERNPDRETPDHAFAQKCPHCKSTAAPVVAPETVVCAHCGADVITPDGLVLAHADGDHNHPEHEPLAMLERARRRAA